MKQRKFCSYCGADALKPLEIDSGYRCDACGKYHYLNSKPSVSAIITRHDRVLLVSDSASAEFWGLPGGFLNHGEDPIAGLYREIREELNITIEVGRLVDARVAPYDEEGEFSLILYYLIKRYDADFQPSGEIHHADWFDIANPPNLRSANSERFMRGLPDLLKD